MARSRPVLRWKAPAGRLRPALSWGFPGAVEWLRGDHGTLVVQFERVMLAPTPADRQRAFDVLRGALALHVDVEETIFEPVLRRAARDAAGPAIDMSFAEHGRIRALLADLVARGAADGEFAPRCEALAAAVARHAETSERHLFPLARRRLGAERLRDLGRRMQTAKILAGAFAGPSAA
jgi:hypothetical protein